MKKLIFIIVIMHFTMNVNSLLSQNFEQLPTKLRDSLLIKIADRAVEKYGPEYNRGYLTPIVKFEGECKEGDHKGESYYTVTYLYDKTKELLDQDFSARVVILEKTGKAIGILFGNSHGYSIEDIEKKGKTVEKMPFITRKMPEKFKY
ncbi:MAG: hypothetical protein A2X17_05285 [Bacteroidetes bacterium GWF2_41_61]|nr:MAG: hypothetical protein A2X20_06105 [Bacteroidetes bacterium GWE2_40_15]OFY32559.1 MAG: hypothetical protein A2X17_05285 [Bacteroidetes bacterium GWF2_41_61]OFY91725.1 MAG: hypothetical protein A2266_02035 [Bacteroidetes bacterium RIFOXYA12_FULL_40_10]HBG24094.1 hypothetical protein [Rikenellaceae bacterium]HBZ26427.1 hypothetical protein [Rikenellaceae bacterium]